MSASTEELAALAARLGGQRVWVVGDLMLDEYLRGTAERISPEAPVPVVTVSSRERRPGGAANVALQLAALGAAVIAAASWPLPQTSPTAIAQPSPALNTS